MLLLHFQVHSAFSLLELKHIIFKFNKFKVYPMVRSLLFHKVNHMLLVETFWIFPTVSSDQSPSNCMLSAPRKSEEEEEAQTDVDLW